MPQHELPESDDDSVMAKVRSVFEKAGMTLLELGVKMGYPVATARQAAWQFMQAEDPRLSTLRKFADAMGTRLEDLTPQKGGRKMARMILETELEEHGCTLTPTEFRELLEEQHVVLHPAWTVDDLVCSPDDAVVFCDHIRRSTGCPDLPDRVILKSLMNARRGH